MSGAEFWDGATRDRAITCARRRAARNSFDAVGGCLQRACTQAGLNAETIEFAAACLGFSGGADDKQAYTRELIRSKKLKITHDAEIALAGATAGEPGIIIIAGTGSMAFGRNAAGNTARAGGWGYIFGDEGGAFDLVRRALRAALQFEEGWGPETSLREILLETTGATDANDLLHAFYTDEYPRTRVAALAPLVTQAAEDEDEIARDILCAAARRLAWFVEGVYRQIFHTGEKMVVAHIGGVFQSTPLVASFRDCVRASIDQEIRLPRFEPAAGAVLEALRLDGNGSDLSAVPESEG